MMPDKERFYLLPITCYAICLLFLCLQSGCNRTGESPEKLEKGVPQFTDVTAEAGLGNFKHDTGGYGQSLMPEIVGGGGGIIDYNGDDWPDILLVAGGAWTHYENRVVQGLHLYENKKNGTFAEVTDEAGLGNFNAYGFGVSVADYDNDGDEDFFLSTLHENKLFENEGGRFQERGKEAGLANESDWSSSSAFFDADRDGWVDLFVASYVDWSPEKDLNCTFEEMKVFCTPTEYTGISSYFYHNNGDGTFSNHTEIAGFSKGVDAVKDKSLGVAVLDFNQDGWPDLTIGNDTENDMLFENNGDGTFKEVGLQSGVAVSQHGYARAGMGLDTGVVDSTGAVSIFVGNFSDETISVFRYNGSGQFLDRASASRLGFPSTLTLTFGLLLADIDLDTDLDLLTANGHVLTHINRISQAIEFKQRPQLYLNKGDGVFDEFRATSGPINTPMVARGLTKLDYDRDGDVDLLFIENDGPAHLLRNDTAGGAFLRVRTKGVKSNRDGLGTHIIAYVDGLAMSRWVHTGGSFLTSPEKPVTFGLGSNETVDSLQVNWPAGTVDVFVDIEKNQEILIVEGTGNYEQISLKNKDL